MSGILNVQKDSVELLQSKPAGLKAPKQEW
jgi:hypothetical protein